MTAYTANTVSEEIHSLCGMGRHACEALRAGMACQAIFVWKHASVSDGFLPRPRDVEQPVTNDGQLGVPRTMHAIGHMADVALVIRNPTVLIMPRRQRATIGITHVMHERRHDMARRARADGFGFFEEHNSRA